jgi:hypothetical protein
VGEGDLLKPLNRETPRCAFGRFFKIATVLLPLVAGCQHSPASHTPESPGSKSAQVTGVPKVLGETAAVPASVFDPAIAEIRSETKVPIILPSKLPAVLVEGGIKLASGLLSQTGYEISLYYDTDATDATFAALFSGSTEVFSDLPNTQPVKLENGITGMFRPVSCGGSCAPANLWWAKGAVMYQIQIKLPMAMDERQQEKALVEAANSSVAVSTYAVPSRQE